MAEEDGNRPSLSLVRHYRAPPEAVWRAWTEAEALRQWFHPDDIAEVPLVEADVRVAGRYHIRMRSPDGEEHDVSGIYREVTPPERLVFTWAWKSTPERESLVTVTLEPDNGGTRLTLLQEGFFDQRARDLHEEGWTGCLDQLGRFIGP